MKLETKRLELNLQTPAEVLEWVESLSPEVRSQISPDWLARLQQLTGPDPWSCMFSINRIEDQTKVGSCGFYGPPDTEGTVEIAYGIDEPFQNQGFATESSQALIDFASQQVAVSIVRAHTKSDNPASERVLNKLGFRFKGEIEHPEDGTVNRWELPKSQPAA